MHELVSYMQYLSWLHSFYFLCLILYPLNLRDDHFLIYTVSRCYSWYLADTRCHAYPFMLTCLITVYLCLVLSMRIHVAYLISCYIYMMTVALFASCHCMHSRRLWLPCGWDGRWPGPHARPLMGSGSLERAACPVMPPTRSLMGSVCWSRGQQGPPSQT